MKNNFKKTFKAYYVGTEHNFQWIGHPEEGCEIIFVDVNSKSPDRKACYEFCKNNYCTKDYFKVRAKRCSENDLYEYEGRNVCEYTIRQYLATNAYREYLKQFMEQNVGKQCYIYSGQWCIYWCDDGVGYTHIFENRGVYEVNELNNWVGHCGGEKKIKFELIK